MTATLKPPVGASDHVQGPADAPVTLVEYGDYECPHCGRAHPVVKAVERRMGKQLRFVFRNFPLVESHPRAERAAEAAEATDADGRFWEMHDMLFEHQDALDDEDLLNFAEAVGADAHRVARDLEAGTYTPKVRADFMSGVRSGVNGTPTFFINGARYDGSWEGAELLAALKDAAKVAAKG